MPLHGLLYLVCLASLIHHCHSDEFPTMSDASTAEAVNTPDAQQQEPGPRGQRQEPIEKIHAENFGDGEGAIGKGVGVKY